MLAQLIQFVVNKRVPAGTVHIGGLPDAEVTGTEAADGRPGGELLGKCQGHQQQGEAHSYELDHAVQGKFQAQSFEAGASAVGQQGI